MTGVFEEACWNGQHEECGVAGCECPCRESDGGKAVSDA